MRQGHARGRIAQPGMLAVLAVVGLSLTGAAVAQGVAERLEEARARLQALGAPLDLRDLAGPPVPDEENAALAYEQASEARDFTAGAAALISDVVHGDADLTDPDVAAAAEDALARNTTALRLLHQAAAMPQCRFNVDRTEPPAAFPYTGRLRSCARLLAFEAILRAHEGRGEEALQAYQASLSVGQVADELLLVGQMTRYAIVGIGSDALKAVLNQTQPPEAACRSAADDVRRRDLLSAYVEALKGECAVGLWAFRLVESSRRPLEDLRDLADDLEGVPAEWREALDGVGPDSRAVVSAWLQADELSYLEIMADLIERGDLPYREIASVRPSLEDRLGSLPADTPRVLTTLLVPVSGKTPMGRDRAIAALGLDQIALLLKGYRARHGQYPATLEQLREYAGYELPLDPFSGEPFVYRREGKGFLIYSWGPNLKDDGGQEPPTGKRDEGDVAFRCPS